MSMQTLLKGIDKGFYREAYGSKQSALARFAEEAEKAGVGPDAAELREREKEFLSRFRVGDPWGRRAELVRDFARKTYAVEAALRESGVIVRGPEASTVEKVYAKNTSTVLFPTFVESQVVAGILLMSLVSDMVAAETPVNSHTAEHLRMNEVEGDRVMAEIGEGAEVPELTIKTADASIKLRKFGGRLNVTYEVLRLQRMNVVSLFLQRMGQQIGVDETDLAIQTAIAGDGNTGSAVVDTDAEVSGTLDYDELIRLALAFPKGYEFRVAITNDTQMRTILNMAEFKDVRAGFDFQTSGRFPNPLGAGWQRWTSTGSTSFSTDRILAMDNRYAMVQYTEGGLILETDRWIDKQIEGTVASKWTGFGKLDYNATQCLDITT